MPGAGWPENTLQQRDNEMALDLVAAGRARSFDRDAALLRLASEGKRAQPPRCAWIKVGPAPV
jgi:hypothetical protein